MKRLLTVVLIALLSIGVTSCKPSTVSQEAYDLGNQAVAATEKYLSGDASQSNLHNELEDIHDRLSEIPASKSEKDDSSIKAYVLFLSIDVNPLLSGTREDVEKHLASLKEYLS